MDKNLDTQPNEHNLVMAWYNPAISGYEFFQPTGELIRFGFEASVLIEDNWGKSNPGFAIANIKICVKIVNEIPINSCSMC